MDLEDPATPAAAALATLSSALDGLVRAVEDGGLDHLDTGQFVGFLQGFESVRNRMPLVGHRLLRDAAERNLPEQLCQPRLARLLSAVLRISPAEASRRVRAGEQLGGQTSLLGQVGAPRRPVLAAAQRSGAVTPEQVQIILSGLAKVDRAGFDPADLDPG